MLTKIGEPMVLEQARQDLDGLVAELEEELHEIRGETRPCHLMEAAVDGLRGALDPDWRGGAYGVALGDAVINVGDVVAWE